MKMYKYKVDYNVNFWGSRKNSGYVFADSKEDARAKLESRYGKVDYTNLSQSTIIDYKIHEVIYTDSDNIIETVSTDKTDKDKLVEAIGCLIMNSIK